MVFEVILIGSERVLTFSWSYMSVVDRSAEVQAIRYEISESPKLIGQSIQTFHAPHSFQAERTTSMFAPSSDCSYFLTLQLSGVSSFFRLSNAV